MTLFHPFGGNLLEDGGGPGHVFENLRSRIIVTMQVTLRSMSIGVTRLEWDMLTTVLVLVQFCGDWSYRRREAAKERLCCRLLCMTSDGQGPWVT